jgi:hypothetical protein
MDGGHNRQAVLLDDLDGSPLHPPAFVLVW